MKLWGIPPSSFPCGCDYTFCNINASTCTLEAYVSVSSYATMSRNNRQADVAVTAAVMTALVLVTAGCRLVSWKISGVGLWLDDWIVLIAVVR